MSQFMQRFDRISEANWLLLILGLGLSLRLAVLLLYPHSPESDELAYLSMARNLAAGNTMVDTAGNHAMYNMGYPFLVLSPVFFLFGEKLAVVRLANALLGVSSILLCYSVAQAAGAGKAGRLLAAALWALYLPASLYIAYVAKENLMVPLMLGVIWCGLRLARKVDARVISVCGLLFGLLALTGNAALSLAAPVTLAVFAGTRQWGTRLATLAAIALVTILVALPWLARNNRLLGAPVLNTNGGFNLYLGNNPAATGMFISIGDTPRGATWGQLRKSGEIQASETLKREATSWIAGHPAEFALLALKKMVHFWTPPVHSGQYQVSIAERIVRIVWAIQFFILTGAAIASVWLRTRGKQLAILWCAIAAYTAVHMIFYVIFRYREPIMPLLCVLAAFALERLASSKEGRGGIGISRGGAAA